METLHTGRLWKIRERRRLLEGTPYRYYCSICLITRDENQYLREWLDWHIGQGVEHFYIYDHNSKQSVREFVGALGGEYAEKITFMQWCGKHGNAQRDAYNDCMQRFRGESRWIGFIDTDEQVRVKTGEGLPAFLKRYEKYAGVYMIWLTYDANNQVKKEKGALRERFTRLTAEKSLGCGMGKIFAQGMLLQEMHTHSGIPEDGFSIVGEDQTALQENSIWKTNPTTDLICVDHYYTKSYEEWLEKLCRGSVDADYLRKYDEFFFCNPDMEYCRENIDLAQQYEAD